MSIYGVAYVIATWLLAFWLGRQWESCVRDARDLEARVDEVIRVRAITAFHAKHDAGGSYDECWDAAIHAAQGANHAD